MDAREAEALLLSRCTVAAREANTKAQDQREANVFHLAATVVRSQYPAEAENLARASDHYFAAHPDSRLTLGEVVGHGWVVSLPRLRDMLNHRFGGR